jgi:hypothetical protein
MIEIKALFTRSPLQHGNKKFENSNNSKPSLRVQFNADDIATHAGQFLKRFFKKTCEKENIFFPILATDFVLVTVFVAMYHPENNKLSKKNICLAVANCAIF